MSTAKLNRLKRKNKLLGFYKPTSDKIFIAILIGAIPFILFLLVVNIQYNVECADANSASCGNHPPLINSNPLKYYSLMLAQWFVYYTFACFISYIRDKPNLSKNKKGGLIALTVIMFIILMKVLFSLL